MRCAVCENNNFAILFRKKRMALIKCLDCGLVQVDNTSTAFDIKLYDYYKDRIGLTAKELYSDITAKRYIDLLKRLEIYRKNGRLLDIGCGEGHFLSLAKENGWEATGIETAPYAVQICRKLDINVMSADLLKIDLEDDYYDAVTMFEVLEHLTYPREYLSKVNDILRKGGILILTTPNFNCITRFLLQKRWSWINEEHLFYFTTRTLRQLLRKCNFSIIKLSVKHITLPELYRLFLFRDKTDGIYNRNQTIRKIIEENIFLGFLKYGTNKILNLTGTGEVIECICQKI